VVGLVLLNVGLGLLLLHRKLSPRPGLPPGHPDVAAPAPLGASENLPPGHPDVSGPQGENAIGSGAGNPAESTDLAAIEKAAERGAPELAISGTVKLSPKLKEPWPAGAPVFVIARSVDGGPPFAVRRYDGMKPPFKYELGSENVMLGGAGPRRLTISVRVDQDGDAMTRQLGDLEGGPSAAVGPKGSVDVTVDRPAELQPAR
jgi:hypothetical protein